MRGAIIEIGYGGPSELYATTPAHVDDAYVKSCAKGYVPFVTVRDLDQLTINPGHEPDSLPDTLVTAATPFTLRSQRILIRHLIAGK